MTEPTHEVNVAQVLAVIGEQYMELRLTRELLARAQARIKELETKESKDDPSTGTINP